MKALQTAVGGLLIVLGVVGYVRTRDLVRYLVNLSDPPLSQAAKDRISASTLLYHLIAGLTALSGIVVVVLATT